MIPEARAWRVAWLFGAALFAIEAEAKAEPQWGAGIVASGCLLGRRDTLFQRAAFCGRVRADALFFRERTSDFAFGAYASLGTAAFEDLRLSVGASALLPIIEDFPLVLSVGPFVRDERDLGLDASLFWGLRSYNFRASYNFSAGVVLSNEHTFGERKSNALALGVQVDGLVLALPFILLWGALH